MYRPPPPPQPYGPLPRRDMSTFKKISIAFAVMVTVILLVVFLFSGSKEPEGPEGPEGPEEPRGLQGAKGPQEYSKPACTLKAEGITDACRKTIWGKTFYYWNREKNKNDETWKSALNHGLHGTLANTNDCGTDDRDTYWCASGRQPYKNLFERYAHPPACVRPL